MEWYDGKHVKVDCPVCTHDYLQGRIDPDGHLLRRVLENAHSRPVPAYTRGCGC